MCKTNSFLSVIIVVHIATYGERDLEATLAIMLRMHEFLPSISSYEMVSRIDTLQSYHNFYVLKTNVNQFKARIL